MGENVADQKLTGVFQGLSWKFPTGTRTTFILGDRPGGYFFRSVIYAH